jgi:hypothetical protein
MQKNVQKKTKIQNPPRGPISGPDFSGREGPGKPPEVGVGTESCKRFASDRKIISRIYGFVDLPAGPWARKAALSRTHSKNALRGTEPAVRPQVLECARDSAALAVEDFRISGFVRWRALSRFFQAGNIKLVHLHHRLPHPLRLFLVLVIEQFDQDRRNNLP